MLEEKIDFCKNWGGKNIYEHAIKFRHHNNIKKFEHIGLSTSMSQYQNRS